MKWAAPAKFGSVLKEKFSKIIYVIVNFQEECVSPSFRVTQIALCSRFSIHLRWEFKAAEQWFSFKITAFYFRLIRVWIFCQIVFFSLSSSSSSSSSSLTFHRHRVEWREQRLTTRINFVMCSGAYVISPTIIDKFLFGSHIRNDKWSKQTRQDSGGGGGGGPPCVYMRETNLNAINYSKRSVDIIFLFPN